MPYIKSNGIFACPSAPRVGWSGNWNTGTPVTATTPLNSYVVNCSQVFQGHSLAAIQDAAGKVLIHEHQTQYQVAQWASVYTNSGYSGSSPRNWPDWSPTGGSDSSFNPCVHLDGQNSAFCDGHVKYYTQASAMGNRAALFAQ